MSDDRIDHEFADRFDDWVREVARDYNRPAAPVPRDQMWQAIATARAGARRGTTPPRPRWSVAAPPWRIAAAALLLVGAGIGIGYAVRGPGEPRPGVAGTASAPDDSGTGITTYDVATAEHLTSAEVLLTMFQAAGDAESADAARRWARSLLSTTRLLLDSPAAADAERRRLFEDLERILIQIVQLPADAAADERAYVEGVIARDAFLTRIRTSIPAGWASGS